MTSIEVGKYKYTVMAQGITSASGTFNFLTDDDLRINGMNCIKNMDDLLLYSETLEGLKKRIINVPNIL